MQNTAQSGTCTCLARAPVPVAIAQVGNAGPADCAAVSEPALEKALGIHDPAHGIALELPYITGQYNACCMGSLCFYHLVVCTGTL